MDKDIKLFTEDTTKCDPTFYVHRKANDSTWNSGTWEDTKEDHIDRIADYIEADIDVLRKIIRKVTCNGADKEQCKLIKSAICNELHITKEDVDRGLLLDL